MHAKVSAGSHFESLSCLQESILLQLSSRRRFMTTHGTRPSTRFGDLGRQPDFELGLPRPLVGSVLDSSGVEQFGISETSTASTDGSVTENLSVYFLGSGEAASKLQRAFR